MTTKTAPPVGSDEVAAVAERPAEGSPNTSDAQPANRSTVTLRRVIKTLITTLLLLGALAVVWPAQHGGRLGITVVNGHSMEPGMRTGDIVITWRRDAYAPGDVIVYPVPEGPGKGLNVVHRLTAIEPDGSLITKGDNNGNRDPWRPAQADVLGSEIAFVPAAGLGINFIRRPIVVILLLALVAAICVFIFMLDLTAETEPRKRQPRRWRRERNTPDAPDIE